jgi:hypothetical protein
MTDHKQVDFRAFRSLKTHLSAADFGECFVGRRIDVQRQCLLPCAVADAAGGIS